MVYTDINIILSVYWYKYQQYWYTHTSGSSVDQPIATIIIAIWISELYCTVTEYLAIVRMIKCL